MKQGDLFKLADPNFHESIGILPKWRIGDSAGAGQNEIYPYYDADQCEEILDSACGISDWENEYREVNGILVCSIRIYVDGEPREKSDAGGGRESRKASMSDADKEAFMAKSAASGAFVRASAKWGIGRHLQLLPKITLRNAGSGVMLAPDNTKLNTPQELTVWCNKVSPSVNFLMAVYRLNKVKFENSEDGTKLISELRTFIQR